MYPIIKTLFAGVVLASAGAAGADTLYSQPFVDDSEGVASQSAQIIAYDDFTLSGPATITGVDFTGAYFNPASPAPITDFVVQIYSDAAGVPGASLYSDFVAGDGGESLFSCEFGSGDCGTYSVGASFAAAGGTKYWLSIVPHLQFPPQWAWAAGTGGDGASYGLFGTGYAVPFDLAFTLTGNSDVPEPAGWALMLVGFGGLGVALRARRKTPTVTV